MCGRLSGDFNRHVSRDVVYTYQTIRLRVASSCVHAAIVNSDKLTATEQDGDYH